MGPFCFKTGLFGRFRPVSRPFSDSWHRFASKRDGQRPNWASGACFRVTSDDRTTCNKSLCAAPFFPIFRRRGKSLCELFLSSFAGKETHKHKDFWSIIASSVPRRGGVFGVLFFRSVAVREERSLVASALLTVRSQSLRSFCHCLTCTSCLRSCWVCLKISLVRQPQERKILCVKTLWVFFGAPILPRHELIE